MLCLILSQTFGSLVSAITIEQLRQDPQLTPKRFASYFSKFRFEARNEVQRPEEFLANQAGDCDDYATLAAAIFKEKGFQTKLILIRMPEEIHMVCYIVEAGCYLDYNKRSFLSRTVDTNGSIEDIAKKVARSFDAPWLTASEFDGNQGSGQIGRSVTARGAEAMVGVRTERSQVVSRVTPTPATAPRPARIAEPMLAVASRN